MKLSLLYRKVSQEMMRSGGYLRLVIYDHDFLRKNEFLGEALAL